jgi:predicted secreted acid phosphatase
MDFLTIIILIIILLIISTFLKEKFYYNETEDNMVRKNVNIYQVAYDLGINYLNTMNKRDYYNLKHPAVMFDIDDTLIDYSGSPIKPIIKLLNKCLSEELMVIIITARSSIFYDHTVNELIKNKIKWTYLYMRNANDSINTFKSNIKKNLAQNEDINIIMSIGDNIIDIDGEYSGYWIKLPNNNDPNLYHLNSNGKPELINV